MSFDKNELEKSRIGKTTALKNLNAENCKRGRHQSDKIAIDF